MWCAGLTGTPHAAASPGIRVRPTVASEDRKMADATLLSTGLDTHETNCGVGPCHPQPVADAQWERPTGNPPPVLATDTSFRHSFWWRDRQRVFAGLEHAFGNSPRTTRFGFCGTRAFVQASAADPPEYRVLSERCRDRWCRACATQRARTVAANIVDHLADRTARFLTLTIKTTDLSLRQSIQKLFSSFAKLRQTRLWRRRVTGGVATCEVKRTADGTSWHPHLHLIIEGKYVHKPDLVREWYRITLDSFIIHIRPMDTASGAAEYVTKYLRKPVPAEIVRAPEHLAEAMLALHGRRMVTTFGDWRGTKLTEVADAGDWTTLYPFRDLVANARGGDPDARRILRHLLGQHRLDPDKLTTYFAQLPDSQLSLDLDERPPPTVHPDTIL